MGNGYVNIEGNSIYFEFINNGYLQGNTPLLIFLHQGVGSIKQWGDFPQMLSESVKCPALLYDRYGYGKSDGLKEKREVDYLNKEALVVLPELIKKLNIENKIILIGHSDGGSIALIYAANHSSLIAHSSSLFADLSCVIVEAPHIFVEEKSVDGIRNTVKEYEAGVLKRALSKYHKGKTDTMFYGWADIWCSEKFKSWSVEKMMKDIKVPVLAIQGVQDEYGTLAQIENIKKAAGDNVSLSIIEDCDHIPHNAYKNEVLEMMKIFIIKSCS
jgi:pimeloyl-ACP methyl ester carboxylesterase